MQRFRGGLVIKAHRLVYHSTLGWIVIKKKKVQSTVAREALGRTGSGFMVQGLGIRVEGLELKL